MYFDEFKHQLPDIDPEETEDWLASLDQVVAQEGEMRARFLMYKLLKRARQLEIGLPPLTQTRYINTISPEQEPDFPGDEELERRIRRLIRWNAVAMVLRANNQFSGIGGHLATYASAATLYEVGFNHFFRGKDGEGSGDQIFYQGHAAPGIYARAFLEGRLSVDQLDHFRRETMGVPGLSSYPHPRLMPEFWEYPTVSMGLGPISAIYQARYNRYLHNRGLLDTSGSRVWAFLGDGEADEPESLGALHLAAREGLDNLTFVVNCNLQRLDGPVRGNGKIIQELEAVFRGSGWNVIKVIWAREWDELLARDVDGLLVQKMNDTLDGEFQKFSVAGGAYIREHFFGPDPRLRKLVEHLSDDDLAKLRRGGHDYRKVYAAYKAAVAHKGAPTVILAHTVKGWTLGPGVEARNITHQAKKLSEAELRIFRDRLELPIPDDTLKEAPYYHPGPESEEVRYLVERRRQLGGPLPKRVVRSTPLPAPASAVDAEFSAGSQTPVSTTMVFTRILRNLIRDPELGPRIVPIIPDEARTFGMDPLFKEVGIYSALGQRYEPVDSDLVLSYREATNGQVIEEGITEAGSMASFQAAGTSYATHSLPTIPFYIFYSMFGFQRTGDQMWAFGDARGRGFLMGATAGRTTLTGEGLQHDDGHTHILASTVPNVRAYDPAFAYELAAVVRDGIKRMYGSKPEDVFYYITIYNENYVQPARPADVADEDILRGIYRFAPAPDIDRDANPARLVGSGSILGQVLAARDLLAERFGVAAEVYSAPSFPLLRRDALEAERWNRLHPEAKTPRVPYVSTILPQDGGPIVAATDWMKSLPDMVARWLPPTYLSLGTDGFGRSDTRENLRALFEIDPSHIAAATMVALARCGAVPASRATKAIRALGIDPDKADPLAV
jgi:pyruvate dehydrogenase E1 component